MGERLSGGLVEFWLVAGSGEGEFVGVDEGVVVAAEEEQVGGRGWSALGPGDDVVAVAPFGVAVAAGEGAMSVSGDDGVAHWFGDEAQAAADVDNLRIGSEHDPSELGVACQTIDGGFVEDVWADFGQRRIWAAERFWVDVDEQGGGGWSVTFGYDKVEQGGGASL